MPTCKRMISWLRSFRRDQSGSPAVEFAIIAPILVTMTMGLVEFARYGYTQSALNFAAQEATRYAIVRGGTITEAELEAVAADAMLFLDSGLSAFCITAPTDTLTAEITVTIDYTYQPIFTLLGDGFNMSGVSAGFIAFTALNVASGIETDCAEVVI